MSEKPPEVVRVGMEGIEGVPSAWLELGARDDLRYGVKVYDASAPDAVTKAIVAFERLEEYAARYKARRLKQLIDERTRERK